ncbi:hypothetical protein ABPG74_022340 [Tetrahymena malaccensis]
MSESKKTIKNQEKDLQKQENINQLLDESKSILYQDICDNKISIKFEKKDINQHCILRADSQDDLLITLDGWNQGHNNLIIWQGSLYKEIQRIQFTKSNKMSDLCFLNFNKNIFFVGGEDKYLRIYFNQVSNNFSYNYQEIYTLRLSNKINCIKCLNDETVIVGSKNGPIHIIKFINFSQDINAKYLNSNQESSNVKEENDKIKEKIDLKIEQQLVELHEKKINEIYIYQQRYLFSIGEDKNFILFDTLESKKIICYKQQSCIRCGYLDQIDEKFYTGNTAGEITIYKFENSQNEFKCQELRKININTYIYQIFAFQKTSYIMYSTNKRQWFLSDTLSDQVVQQSSTYSDYISVIHQLPNEDIFLGEGKNLFQIYQLAKKI